MPTADYQPPRSPQEEEALVGQLLGDRYRVQAKIAEGGMGVVYRATHVVIEKDVAIKALRPRHAAAGTVAERFAVEARLASRIKHRNVVEISDYGTTAGGCPYYVMELLGGSSLAEVIDHKAREGGALSPKRALGLTAEICRGLAAAHRQGVIHRDLKPDNVFLSITPEGERLKLIDFGIARGDDSKALTTPGSVVGTPEYMSPEQAQGRDLDGRSDLYAVGVILFEMLVGRVPFRGDTLANVLAKQVFDAPPTLSHFQPSFATDSNGQALERLVARFLAKNPAERPAGAEEAVLELEEAISELEDPVGRRTDSKKSTVAIGSWSVGSSPDLSGSRPRTFSPAMAEPLPAPRPAPVVEFERPNRPSVIVREGTPVTHIPAVPTTPPPAAVSTSQPPVVDPLATKSQPKGHKPSILPMIVLGTGAAVCAGLLTAGVVNYLEQQRIRAERARDAEEPATLSSTARPAVPAPARPVRQPVPEASPDPEPMGTSGEAPAEDNAEGQAPRGVDPSGSDDAHSRPPATQKRKGSKLDGSALPPVQKNGRGKRPPKPRDRAPEPSVGLDHLKDPFTEN